MNPAKELTFREDVEQMIFLIRGQRVIMLDRDLARLYRVETKYLNRQVRRNQDRFPEEFMFQLSREERDELVTNCHRLKTLKHSTSLPFAFTENGVAMLASVLKSERAVKISIYIIKTFVKLRRWVATQKELAIKLRELEARVEQHDEEIWGIVHMLQEMINPPEPPTKFSLN
jgi:phage regulator Rha-like protein